MEPTSLTDVTTTARGDCRAGQLKLRHNALGPGALVYQGIPHISPATSLTSLLPLIALKPAR